MEWTVQTDDGRTLAVEDAGDPAGRPVMVHVGTPNSRHLYGRTVADATARGVRLISYDRPGYGESTPHRGRTMADCASDARAICGALGIGRLAMWGYSGGGPPLLACAALLPDLVTAAASLASSAPYDAEGLDWLAGMGPDAADWVALMFADWTAARAVTEQERAEMLAKSPAELAAGMRQARSADDAAFLLDEAICMQQAYASSIDGVLDDNLAQVIPWGFDVSQIEVPVLLLHGRLDEAVPVGHGEWLAAHIPGVEARLFADEGHGTLRENHIGEVHAWLLSRFLWPNGPGVTPPGPPDAYLSSSLAITSCWIWLVPS
jgi:pimeloyl-ACP methyl ester carboxylesterase